MVAVGDGDSVGVDVGWSGLGVRVAVAGWVDCNGKVEVAGRVKSERNAGCAWQAVASMATNSTHRKYWPWAASFLRLYLKQPERVPSLTSNPRQRNPDMFERRLNLNQNRGV